MYREMPNALNSKPLRLIAWYILTGTNILTVFIHAKDKTFIFCFLSRTSRFVKEHYVT